LAYLFLSLSLSLCVCVCVCVCDAMKWRTWARAMGVGPLSHLLHVSRKLLAQCEGSGVLRVRPANLDDVLEFICLRCQGCLHTTLSDQETPCTHTHTHTAHGCSGDPSGEGFAFNNFLYKHNTVPKSSAPSQATNDETTAVFNPKIRHNDRKDQHQR
jgi:hypothetical protein